MLSRHFRLHFYRLIKRQNRFQISDSGPYINFFSASLIKISSINRKIIKQVDRLEDKFFWFHLILSALKIFIPQFRRLQREKRIIFNFSVSYNTPLLPTNGENKKPEARKIKFYAERPLFIISDRPDRCCTYNAARFDKNLCSE